MESDVRILCVDDHADTNDLVSITLSMDGYRVSSAKSANEAMILINNQPFDVYIIDVQMPNINGLELCRRIRANDEDVPIIIYSAAAYEADKTAGYDAGATRYLVKPEGFNAIADVVKDVVSQSRSMNVLRCQTQSAAKG
jgi:two-component system phosphate regulon response regulator OmpR